MTNFQVKRNVNIGSDNMITEIKQYFKRMKLESDLNTSCYRFAFEMFGDSYSRANAMLSLFAQRIEAAEKFNANARIKPIDVESYRKAYYRCEFGIDELDYIGFFDRNQEKTAAPAVKSQSIDAMLQ